VTERRGEQNSQAQPASDQSPKIHKFVTHTAIAR
jgi:hypothetical protein